MWAMGEGCKTMQECPELAVLRLLKATGDILMTLRVSWPFRRSLKYPQPGMMLLGRQCGVLQQPVAPDLPEKWLILGNAGLLHMEGRHTAELRLHVTSPSSQELLPMHTRSRGL